MTTYPSRKKILLKQRAKPLDVTKFAGKNRWFFQDCEMMSPTQTFSIYSWLVNDMKTDFNFVEDTIRDLYFFVTAGLQADRVEAVVRGAFPPGSAPGGPADAAGDGEDGSQEAGGGMGLMGPRAGRATMTAYLTRKRILLKQQVSLKDVTVFTGKNGWYFEDEELASPQQTFSLYNWLLDDLNAAFDYVEDTIREVYFFVTVGPQSDMVEAVVRGAFPCWTHDEVVQQARGAQGADAETRIEALQRLSAVAPEQAQPEDLALYEAALTDPDPDIRYAGVEAAGYAGVEAVGYAEWPVLVERLRRMQGEDPDPEVRLAALAMLQAMEQNRADQDPKTEAARRKAGWE